MTTLAISTSISIIISTFISTYYFSYLNIMIYSSYSTPYFWFLLFYYGYSLYLVLNTEYNGGTIKWKWLHYLAQVAMGFVFVSNVLVMMVVSWQFKRDETYLDYEDHILIFVFN